MGKYSFVVLLNATAIQRWIKVNKGCLWQMDVRGRVFFPSKGNKHRRAIIRLLSDMRAVAINFGYPSSQRAPTMIRLKIVFSGNCGRNKWCIIGGDPIHSKRFGKLDQFLSISHKCDIVIMSDDGRHKWTANFHFPFAVLIVPVNSLASLLLTLQIDSIKCASVKPLLTDRSLFHLPALSAWSRPTNLSEKQANAPVIGTLVVNARSVVLHKDAFDGSDNGIHNLWPRVPFGHHNKAWPPYLARGGREQRSAASES